MNAMIRFAHKYSVFHVLMLMIWRLELPADTPLARWEAELAKVEDPRVRKHLRGINERMYATLAWHMASGSILLMIGLVGWIAYVAGGELCRFIGRRLSTPYPSVDDFIRLERVPGLPRLEGFGYETSRLSVA